MPRAFKYLFGTHNEDEEVWSWDGAQLEFRVAAQLGNDDVATEEIVDGVDIHTVTGQVLADAGEPGFKDMDPATRRQASKGQCVPMYTQILTKQGWKTYDDLVEGELVCTYNQEKDVLEWEPLLEKVKHDNMPTVKMGNAHWSTVSTGHHRWYGLRTFDRGSHRETLPWVFTTDEIRKSDKITVSARLTAEGGVSPSDAAIVAWIMTDGTYSISALTGTTSQGLDGRRRGFSASIIQKKEENFSRIEKALKESGMSWRKVKHGNNGCFAWRLQSQELRDLFNRVGLGLDDPEEKLPVWVLSLGEEARQSFVDTCFYAEGHDRGFGVRRISQNAGPVKEAIHTAAFLCGYDVRVSTTPKERVKRANADHAVMTLRTRRHVTGARLTKTPDETQDVWCPRTGNKTWVMRQGETICITGNTFQPLFLGRGNTKAQNEYAKFFWNKYDDIYQMQQDWIAQCVQNKYYITPYGMRFYFPRARMSASGWVEGSNQIANYGIQGFATGEIMPLALTFAWHYTRGKKVEIFNTVHDSIVARVHKDVDKDWLKRVVVQSMTHDVFEWLSNVYNYEFDKVPLGVGLKIGEAWDVADVEMVWDVTPDGVETYKEK